jgi:glycerophosphoryl diester phosphodiesterase
MRALPGWLTRTPIAHRGLHDAKAGVPENSLAAFEAAIAAGYGIELDLQLSADGVAVVFHDDRLDRLTGRQGALADETVDALGGMRLLGTAEKIPSFRRTLATVAGRAPLLVELKTLGRAVGPLEAAAWHELAGYTGRFAVQSFEPRTVAWFRRHVPDACRGQISGLYRDDRQGQSALRRFLLRNLLLSGPGRPDFIAYDVHGLGRPPVRLARRLGLPVLTWTVRTGEQLTTARALADNVIFEQIRP